MTEISFEDLVTGLRGWARGQTRHEQAAVELLAWHETWLRRPDFRGACITQRAAGLVAIIHWDDARDFVDRGYWFGNPRGVLPASTSQRAVLDLAVALGEDQYRLANMGQVHKAVIAYAVAAAVGLADPMIPKVRRIHNHPDFIPGDETCEACAREAQDEGKR